MSPFQRQGNGNIEKWSLLASGELRLCGSRRTRLGKGGRILLGRKKWRRVSQERGEKQHQRPFSWWMGGSWLGDSAHLGRAAHLPHDARKWESLTGKLLP